MSKFYKKYEVYSPDDLCWIEVKYTPSSGEVTIKDTKVPSSSFRICHSYGEAKQLDQLIALLQHIREKYVS